MFLGSVDLGSLRDGHAHKPNATEPLSCFALFSGLTRSSPFPILLPSTLRKLFLVACRILVSRRCICCRPLYCRHPPICAASRLSFSWTVYSIASPNQHPTLSQTILDHPDPSANRRDVACASIESKGGSRDWPPRAARLD